MRARHGSTRTPPPALDREDVENGPDARRMRGQDSAAADGPLPAPDYVVKKILIPAATVSICSSVSPGKIGRESTCSWIRSVTGKSPVA